MDQPSAEPSVLASTPVDWTSSGMFRVVDQLPSSPGVVFTMEDMVPSGAKRATPTAASVPVQPVPATEKAVSEGLTMLCWSSANLMAPSARAGEAAREAPMAAAITLAAARGRPRRMSTPRLMGIGGNR